MSRKARIPSALPRSRSARDRTSQRSVEPHDACPSSTHRPHQRSEPLRPGPQSAIAMAFPQLRDINSDKGFSIVRHGSSSCDEDRLGQSEQPSDAQCRASHLTLPRHTVLPTSRPCMTRSKPALRSRHDRTGHPQGDRQGSRPKSKPAPPRSATRLTGLPATAVTPANRALPP